MTKKYTTDKAPDMAVTIGAGGVHVELHDGLVKVESKYAMQIEQYDAYDPDLHMDKFGLPVRVR